ncbi:MAG: heat shock protein, Hsp20 family, HSP20 family protein [Candidatus Peregrinibacteria bacterium GW2011_GWE2_39_6]|nr:MAG: heat shock protein, Hsp20 family, HSP20 family protein [Candidatus Peregrinibacteria bacterium GW2011_GWF2_39_17]KKR24830.1 MAG: heat shock protein, Hsp20 family, HSP20 family protein [Candidatus Peregrinibacteria bacterium GW2011_GWE2_39_6]HCW32779.1 hypothetical protein [Candidatus Peregrinibacteria bacterium]
MHPIGIGQLKGKREDVAPNLLSRHTFVSPEPEVNINTTKKEIEGQLSVDVYQTEKDIVIIAPIAGTSADQISISITEDVITIKGKREMPLFDHINKIDFYIQECFWGNFSRSIVLPVAVDTNQVEARFKKNVLIIRIPKTEYIKTRVVRIREE